MLFSSNGSFETGIPDGGVDPAVESVAEIGDSGMGVVRLSGWRAHQRWHKIVRRGGVVCDSSSLVGAGNSQLRLVS